MQKLEGEISFIKFRNDENGFKILNLYCKEDDGEVITGMTHVVTGTFPMVEKGDTISVDGFFTVHEKFGKQFKAINFEKIMPKKDKDIIKYLTNFIPGVGIKTAERIVNNFGENTFDIILNEYEKLTDIKGINIDKAEKIANEYFENVAIFEIAKDLEKYDLSMESILKVYNKLGKDTVQIVNENPYILIDIIPRSIKFLILDKIAIESGINTNDLIRIKAFIKFYIERVLADGSTYVLKEDVIDLILKNTTATENDAISAISDLRADGDISIRENRIIPKNVDVSENNIALKLLKMNKNKIQKISKIDEKIKELEKKSQIKLTDVQKKAIKSINKSNVNIITGGPGTGKTTIIKFLIEIFKEEGKEVVITAPTGKAAKRITDVTGHNASTVHRLLSIMPTDDPNIQINMDINELDSDIIIIDEASMVDIYLMNDIVKALNNDMKIFLIGDVDQLPSVGPGNVLKDLIQSGEFNVNILDKIFRQAKTSNIIKNAYRVKNGEKIKVFTGKNEEGDCYTNDLELHITNNSNIVNELINVLEKKDPKDFFYTSQIIVPNKKGFAGSDEVNKIIQNKFNEKDESKPEKKFGNNIFRLDDRIMQIKNDYDITYFEKDFGDGVGIFNGEMGTIKDVDEKENYLEIEFDDGKIAEYTSQSLINLALSYVITVHKSQGSEFEEVVLMLPNVSSYLLNRNLLYTAMTRAKSKLVIIGSREVMDKMVTKERFIKRKTDFINVIKNIKEKMN